MSKTILITGATDGIGLLTAKKLAALGHTLLLHGRDAAKLASAQSQVGGAGETYIADLSKMGDVVAMADAILAKHDHLDVIINNAGVLKLPQALSEAGRDVRFDVNTIAPYILSRKLLPLLPKDGRVVNLSSAAQAPVNIAALMQFHPMAHMEAYAQSKLAITIWTTAMAQAMPDGPVFVSVNPGSLLATKMVKEGFGIAGHDLNIGADILIAMALGDEFAEASGKYFDNDAGCIASPHSAAQDPDHVRHVMAAVQSLAQVHLT